jgi:ankyrin repeat protein
VRDSPLHLAIKYGNRDIVMLLMNAGASVNTICHFNPLSKREQDYTLVIVHQILFQKYLIT